MTINKTTNLTRYFLGKGIKKTGRAFFFLYHDGKNKIELNNEAIEVKEIFGTDENINCLQLVKNLNLVVEKFQLKISDFSFKIRASGGGFESQKVSIIYSVAHSLLAFLLENNAEDKDNIKYFFRQLHFVTVDNRIKERKKIGKTKARKSKPYVKR